METYSMKDFNTTAEYWAYLDILNKDAPLSCPKCGYFMPRTAYFPHGRPCMCMGG